MPSPFSLRDSSRLDGVHPKLIHELEDVFREMAALGHPMMIVQGVRTVAQQQALFSQGRTVPGRIVTMKDGVRHKSDHQPWSDGFGHAVDCGFARVPDPFADALPWETYGVKLEARGLTWGGRWSHPHDSPHAQLDA